MSMFYCAAHDRMEDADFVGYAITDDGAEVCDDAVEAWERGDDLAEDDVPVDA